MAGSERALVLRYRPPGPGENALNILVALGTHEEIGAAILPFALYAEGSTFFLPGNYTGVMRGKGDTTCVGVVQIYNITL